jgi:hypothetical protein
VAILSPGEALRNQRHNLVARLPKLREMMRAVGKHADLTGYQWLGLIAYAQEYRPDLIIELGRGAGNSTCCFLEAARHLRPDPCRVVSICRNEVWLVMTLPRLQEVCPDDFFDPGQFEECDILGYDFGPALAGAKRVLVFWDAHGLEVAECVLGNLLPKIADREHVVIMHDLSDLRCLNLPRGYNGAGLWKGADAEQTNMFLGHVHSHVGQSIAAIDFTTRNRIPLRSADEELHKTFADPGRLAEMRQLLGDELFQLRHYWFYFSVKEARGRPTFPRFTGGRLATAG